MQSRAVTVAAYLAELPEDRRRIVQAVREVILQNLDADYEEGMQYGMIGYYVPHRVYPPGYHCDPRQPLPFAALASQKNYLSLYLMSVYSHEKDGQWFRDAWAKTGKRLNMGKSCVRFKRLEDLPLEVIGEAVRRMPAKKHIAYYESTLQPGSKRNSKEKSPARKSTPSARSKKSGKPSRKATDLKT